MTKTELAARNMLNSLRNPNARMPLIERLRDRESYYGTDAHLAAEYLDEACTLCDRAQDYMRIRLAYHHRYATPALTNAALSVSSEAVTPIFTPLIWAKSWRNDSRPTRSMRFFIPYKMLISPLFVAAIHG